MTLEDRPILVAFPVQRAPPTGQRTATGEPEKNLSSHLVAPWLQKLSRLSRIK